VRRRRHWLNRYYEPSDCRPDDCSEQISSLGHTGYYQTTGEVVRTDVAVLLVQRGCRPDQPVQRTCNCTRIPRLHRRSNLNQTVRHPFRPARVGFRHLPAGPQVRDPVGQHDECNRRPGERPQLFGHDQKGSWLRAGYHLFIRPRKLLATLIAPRHLLLPTTGHLLGNVWCLFWMLLQ